MLNLYLTSVVIRHPESQVTPAGGNKTFVCTAQGDVLWYIDNDWLSTSYENTLRGKGFTFTETHLNGYDYPTSNLTMTVPAVDTLNGTKIQCKTVGSNGVIVASDVAWLWIAGNPLLQTLELPTNVFAKTYSSTSTAS